MPADELAHLGQRSHSLRVVRRVGASGPEGVLIEAADFGDMKVADFGVSGDTTKGVLWGLQNGEGQRHRRETINFNREWTFHLVFETILLTAIADGLRSLPAARQSE